MAISGQLSLGGYTDVQFRYEKEAGLTEELTFLAKRFNLFMFAAVSERVRIASEIEFEEGGEEIVLELAIVDFEIHPAVTFRAGILLSPLGRFNISHDSPINTMVDRPLVSTEVIPTTLSETGAGLYGAIYPSPSFRLTYEAYLVNGFSDGVLSSSEGGTRLANGRRNFEDGNKTPSFTGRLAVSPIPDVEVGFSTHQGPYNDFDMEGLIVDDKRNLGIIALDGEVNWRRYNLNGEFARTNIDVTPFLRGLYAQKQQGFYLEGGIRFLEGVVEILPESVFIAALRYDAIDLDMDIEGDSQKRVTVGLNFKPANETVFKFNYVRHWDRDRFDVETPAAAVLFGLATYF